MKYSGLFLIAFGLINIIFPDILAYVLGGFCVILWTSIFLWGFRFKANKKHEDPYVKFWNYKIYR